MAKAIMVQGTMSNAGKSIITAALCRIFNQDGYKTAPMACTNAYATNPVMNSKHPPDINPGRKIIARFLRESPHFRLMTAQAINIGTLPNASQMNAASLHEYAIIASEKIGVFEPNRLINPKNITIRTPQK